MEEIKNEILDIAKKLEEYITKQDLRFLDEIENLKEKVAELNNEQVQKKFNGLYSQVKTPETAKGENLNKTLDIIEAFENSVKKNIELMEYASDAEKLEQEDENKFRKLERVVIDINPEREVSGRNLGAMVLYDSGNGLQNCDELDEQTKEVACYLWRKCHSVAKGIFYRHNNANMVGSLIENYDHTEEGYNDIFIMGSELDRLPILVQELIKGASNLDISVPLYVKYGNKEIFVNAHRLMENEDMGTKEERREKAQEMYHNLAKLEQEALQEIKKIKGLPTENEYIENPEKNIDKTINNYKKAIQNKNHEKVVIYNNELYNFFKTIKDKDKFGAVNKQILKILDVISKKRTENLTETEANDLLKVIDKIKDIIDAPEKQETPISENIVEIRKEMDDTIGKSLFEGIENEEIKANLDEKISKRFKELKEELKDLLNDPKANKIKIDEVRYEMFVILGIDPYTYGKNKELINSLTEDNKKIFELLKDKHEKATQEIKERITKNLEEQKAKQETEDQKTSKNESKETSLEKRIREIREEMAVLRFGPGAESKAYEGIENTEVDLPNSNLDNDYDKEQFLKLKEEILPLLEKQNKKAENKAKREKGKARVVKAAKSAAKFYQKHKKAILIAAGIALLAVTIASLLPSIMAINSNLWWVAVNAGATPNVGLPAVLHDINLIIGSKIGATYAAGTGVWTLANGATLGAGAIVSGALATLGKVALVGTVGTGLSVAVKNAYKKAKEKIKNRPVKEKNPSKIGTVVSTIKKGLVEGKNKAKEKITEIKEKNTDPVEVEEIKKTDEKSEVKKETEALEKNISKMDKMLEYMYQQGFITEADKKDMLKVSDKKEFLNLLKNKLEQVEPEEKEVEEKTASKR